MLRDVSVNVFSGDSFNINDPNFLFNRTAGRQISMTMREIMKNQRLIGAPSYIADHMLCTEWIIRTATGSTLGSHTDLIAATNFLSKHRIVPAVSHVLEGLESAEEGFEIMKKGDAFGKIVIKIKDENKAKL